MTSLKKTVLALLAISTSVSSFSQSRSAEEIVRSVADNVLANSTFKFVNTKTKETYDNAKSIKNIDSDIRAESIYNQWHYANGVVNIGLLKAASVLNEKKYADYTAHNFEFFFDNMKYFKEGYEKGLKTEFFNHHRMNILDDYGALSAAMLDLDPQQKNKEYVAYTKKGAAFTLNNLLRLADGTWCRETPRQMTVWADDLYMGVPFMARMGKITGEQKYFDDAIKQVENFNKLLYDPHTRLYFHNYYSDVNMVGVAHWLRCNGWVAVAQTELLNNLPENHPKRKELIALLLRQIVGFSRYQDNETGLWHQLIDKPDAYLETSGTAMFTYAVARAVNQGWINKSYLTIAQNGWKGLASKITEKGEIEDVCIGTGIADNISFYYNRPIKLNDYHAIGAVLLAGTEMMKVKK